LSSIKLFSLPFMNILEIFGKIGFGNWHLIMYFCHSNWNLKVMEDFWWHHIVCWSTSMTKIKFDLNSKLANDVW
jgi:hypothetical protein